MTARPRRSRSARPSRMVCNCWAECPSQSTSSPTTFLVHACDRTGSGYRETSCPSRWDHPATCLSVPRCKSGPGPCLPPIQRPKLRRPMLPSRRRGSRSFPRRSLNGAREPRDRPSRARFRPVKQHPRLKDLKRFRLLHHLHLQLLETNTLVQPTAMRSRKFATKTSHRGNHERTIHVWRQAVDYGRQSSSSVQCSGTPIA